ncbi:hypothetical protein [Pedobacter nototheniae]|uniref:hypothetical protein n=1 Tax=Pedobacter nototheniae TaxID=2488994 RepID=UPI00103EA3C1|nr:hypothetical protein [Pedobacter nototheniae]
MSYQTPALKFLLKKLIRQMPFTKKDLEDLPISFCGKDDVWVIVGPCSGTYWRNYKIALDGRKYKTGGTITFKNGQEYRASFYVDTTTFDFVSKDSIYLSIGDDWYNIEEPELLTKLKVSQDDIYPLKWQSDRPLDYHIKSPYILKK